MVLGPPHEGPLPIGMDRMGYDVPPPGADNNNDNVDKWGVPQQRPQVATTAAAECRLLGKAQHDKSGGDPTNSCNTSSSQSDDTKGDNMSKWQPNEEEEEEEAEVVQPMKGMPRYFRRFLRLLWHDDEDDDIDDMEVVPALPRTPSQPPPSPLLKKRS